MTAPQVWVIGAGPAGLMAAETLARAGVGVVMADAAPSPVPGPAAQPGPAAEPAASSGSTPARRIFL